ncbi:Predicted gene 1527 [Apodemus speciosus]|uniref:Predicted gene 1527 n=1 Tax=Apodemus speciosus TaxID=105296 RepID=A0ABQ0EK36_APOSI
MMTQLQNTFSQLNSRISTAFPILPGLFVKDVTADAQGQFILKPREVARTQQLG